MKRVIKHAAFQSAIQAPGVSRLKAAMSLNPNTTPGLVMEYENGLLHLHIGGDEVLIPMMNIKSMTVDKSLEEKPVLKAAK